MYWYRDDVVVNYSGRKGIHIWTGDAVPKDIDKLDEDDDNAINVTTSTSTITSTSVSDFSSDKTVITNVELSRQTVNQRLKSRRRNRNRTLIVSMLEIQMVMPDDAGTYTCAPSNARNHSAVVHVIQGIIYQKFAFFLKQLDQQLPMQISDIFLYFCNCRTGIVCRGSD